MRDDDFSQPVVACVPVVQPAALVPAEQTELVINLLREHNISYYPRLVDLTQSITTAIFLSQLIDATKKNILSKTEDLGVCQPLSTWEKNTSLTRRHIATAVEYLLSQQFIDVVRLQFVTTASYRVNLKQLAIGINDAINLEIGRAHV